MPARTPSLCRERARDPAPRRRGTTWLAFAAAHVHQTEVVLGGASPAARRPCRVARRGARPAEAELAPAHATPGAAADAQSVEARSRPRRLRRSSAWSLLDIGAHGAAAAEASRSTAAQALDGLLPHIAHDGAGGGLRKRRPAAG